MENTILYIENTYITYKILYNKVNRMKTRE